MTEDKNRRIRETAQGWLEIEISGEHAERMLNLALQQGILLHHLQRQDGKISARLLLKDVYALRPLARASHCKFWIKRRAGLPFALAKARRRLSFLLGAGLFALGLYLVCAIIWQVEVASPYSFTAAEREQIIELAAAAGLTEGTPAWRLDRQAISQHILRAEPGLLYAELERNGVRVTINVVWRRDLAAEEVVLPPGDIIATADGIIEDILVRSGTAAVAVGDTVKQGDVLVYGYGGGMLRPASAIIKARVWGSGRAEWPLIEQGRRTTGRQSQGLLLRFGLGEEAPAIWLGPHEASPYQLYSLSQELYRPVLWRNLKLPVELILDTWYEETAYTTNYTEDQALYHAERQAEGLALGELPGACELKSRKTYQMGRQADKVMVQVNLEALADIGQFRPLDEASRQRYQVLMQQQASPAGVIK